MWMYMYQTACMLTWSAEDLSWPFAVFTFSAASEKAIKLETQRIVLFSFLLIAGSGNRKQPAGFGCSLMPFLWFSEQKVRLRVSFSINMITEKKSWTDLQENSAHLTSRNCLQVCIKIKWGKTGKYPTFNPDPCEPGAIFEPWWRYLRFQSTSVVSKPTDWISLKASEEEQEGWAPVCAFHTEDLQSHQSQKLGGKAGAFVFKDLQV